MKLPRLTYTILITLLLLDAVYVLAPQQLAVSLYKLSLITTAGVVGYWLDRALFPYSRPDGYFSRGQSDGVRVDFPIPTSYHMLFAAAILRRAVIVGCAMLAMSLGA